ERRGARRAARVPATAARRRRRPAAAPPDAAGQRHGPPLRRPHPVRGERRGTRRAAHREVGAPAQPRRPAGLPWWRGRPRRRLPGGDGAPGGAGGGRHRPGRRARAGHPAGALPPAVGPAGRPGRGLVGRPARRERRRSAGGGPGRPGAPRRAHRSDQPLPAAPPLRLRRAGLRGRGHAGVGLHRRSARGGSRGGRPGPAVGHPRRPAGAGVPAAALHAPRLRGRRPDRGHRRADGRRSRARRSAGAYGSAPM
ncbi:MAG: Uncharacterized Nudix hydrolase NudL, partial [uncultured Blastococcus sp.]